MSEKIIFWAVLFSCSIFGLRLEGIEKNNRDRWNKPADRGPDKEVPGYLVNLGPTGARATLESKSFTVKYIFKGSPAEGILEIDDVITGVNGKAFEVEHRFGHHLTRMKEFPEIGYEGPIMDFGNAIEDSEGKDGKLTLSVKRGETLLDVVVPLEAIGRFSNSFPRNCEKSALLAKRSIDYLSGHPFLRHEECHAKCLSGLALLAAGKTDEVKELVYDWNKLPKKGIWIWDASYQCILLSEYYLATKDEKVLKTIQSLATILETGQVEDMANYADRTHGGMGKVGHKFRTGGLGHITTIDGYGTMNITTALGLTAWQLAKKCGATVDEKKIDMAYAYLHKSTTKEGFIGYHTHECAYSPSGRQGLAVLAQKLKGDDQASRDYIKTVANGMYDSTKYINDCHADSVLGLSCAVMGVNVSGDDRAIRHMMDYNKAWFNMARCYDGSFVALPARDMYDDGYYISSRLHLTATMALVFTIEQPKLVILGK